MKIETANSKSVRNATQQDLENALSDDAGRGEFIILTDDDGSFMQAAGEDDGPYLLEYRDADSETNFQATEEVTKAQLKAAFSKYLGEDSSWRDSFTWKKLDMGSGCLPLVLLIVSIAIATLR